jgi:MOSC domain-containing protein YiiM
MANLQTSGDTPMAGLSSSPVVLSVSVSGEHTMSKPSADSIELVEGLGVVGDAHFGATVKHRSRVRQDPTQPNLRQVHLVHAELLDELAARDLPVRPGEMGENITTRGVDLLNLPKNTLLRLGDQALILVTGLRNPCAQLNGVQPELLSAVLERAPDGAVVRKAGVMAIVVSSGSVRPGDPITVQLPPEPRRRLEPV